MTEYTPHNWVVIKFTQQVKSGNTGYGRKEKVVYKVLGGWSGGYLDGDYWRLNSGITGVEKQAYLYGFYGSSGSVYWCHQGSYRLTMATSGFYNEMKKRFGDAVELMPEDTNWHEVEW